MTRILLRADDLGYSWGVNCGLAWACDNDLPMSIGLMMNLEPVRHGYSLIAGKGHCLGVHTTISAGRPLCSPDEVPSLVRKDGAFLSSDTYRKATSDPAALEDVEREAEAQYQAFVSMTGREPDYVDVHAVGSANFVSGVRNVAQRHGKPFSYLAKRGEVMRAGESDVVIHGSEGDLDALLSEVRAVDAECQTPVAHILMLHPGFVDAQLLRVSSYTMERTRDAELVRGAKLREFAARDDVELITYRDL